MRADVLKNRYFSWELPAAHVKRLQGEAIPITRRTRTRKRNTSNKTKKYKVTKHGCSIGNTEKWYFPQIKRKFYGRSCHPKWLFHTCTIIWTLLVPTREFDKNVNVWRKQNKLLPKTITNTFECIGDLKFLKKLPVYYVPGKKKCVTGKRNITNRWRSLSCSKLTI